MKVGHLILPLSDKQPIMNDHESVAKTEMERQNLDEQQQTLLPVQQISKKMVTVEILAVTNMLLSPRHCVTRQLHLPMSPSIVRCDNGTGPVLVSMVEMIVIHVLPTVSMEIVVIDEKTMVEMMVATTLSVEMASVKQENLQHLVHKTVKIQDLHVETTSKQK